MDRLIRSGRIGRLFVLGTLVAVCAGAGCGFERPADVEQPLAVTKAVRAQESGRLEEADRLYHDVIRADPKNKYAWYDLGVLDWTRGRVSQADIDYRQALVADPYFAAALFNLANLRAGAKQEAADLYRRAIAADPNYADAYLNLGLLLRDIGRRAEGDAVLARAVELDPSLASRIPQTPVPAQEPSTTATPKP